MRSIWLLPDREQAGYIQAIENEKCSMVHELVNLKDLPPEFILGIPEEVFRSKAENFFLFSQFAKLKSGVSVFCLSAPSGKDVSGRSVAIANLQFLQNGEMPELNPSIPENVSQQDRVWMEKIVSNDGFNKNLRDPVNIMLKAIQDCGVEKTFSSEVLLLARNKPDWMPVKKNLRNIVIKKYKLVISIFCFFIVIAVLCVFTHW